jgi:hypothetical protein
MVDNDVRVRNLGGFPAPCFLLLDEDGHWVPRCHPVTTETDGLVFERGDSSGGCIDGDAVDN